jgi:hypothetical protein
MKNVEGIYFEDSSSGGLCAYPGTEDTVTVALTNLGYATMYVATWSSVLCRIEAIGETEERAVRNLKAIPEKLAASLQRISK